MPSQKDVGKMFGHYARAHSVCLTHYPANDNLRVNLHKFLLQLKCHTPSRRICTTYQRILFAQSDASLFQVRLHFFLMQTVRRSVGLLAYPARAFNKTLILRLSRKLSKRVLLATSINYLAKLLESSAFHSEKKKKHRIVDILVHWNRHTNFIHKLNTHKMNAKCMCVYDA